VRRIRKAKGMLLVEGDPDCRSAGSFFKNPVIGEEEAARVAEISGQEPPRYPVYGKVKVPAAWLIERAGFSKGFALGNAGISTRHTLALINRGGALARVRRISFTRWVSEREEVVSPRHTTGPSSPLSPCTVMTRTSSREKRAGRAGLLRMREPRSTPNAKMTAVTYESV
jgi:hypothetical protein